MNPVAVLSHFYPAAIVSGLETIGTGHINDTFRVNLSLNQVKRSFLLQKLNPVIFPRPEMVMENIQLVAVHLSAQDYPMDVLTPISTDNGQLFYRDESGNAWRLFPFLENAVTFDQVDSPEIAYEAARAFGLFTKALSGLDASRLHVTIPGFHDGLRRLDHLLEVVRNDPYHRVHEVRREIETILEHRDLFKQVAGLDLPLRVIHHDTKINNLLFDQASLQATCVIDLDTVMPGIILSDFGDMMRTYTCPADENQPDLEQVEMRMPFLQALTDGFLESIGDELSPTERAQLFTGGLWMTAMQAVRFLGDYLSGDRYYKTDYPGQNLVRTRNQLTLFRSMWRQLAGNLP